MKAAGARKNNRPFELFIQELIVSNMKQILLTFLLIFTAHKVWAEPVNITFATDWKAQAEHGGFYQALAKGYYSKRGLNVSIRPGGPQTDNPRLMAAGVLDIAMASNNFQPLNLLAAGVNVKVVMASFQKDPQVLMVHPEVSASTIADLKGRPIFMSDSAIATFWPWLKAKFNFKDRQIRKYTYSLAPWLVNKNTVQEGYLSSEPYSARQAGVVPNVFMFADAGYPGYSGMIMARQEFIAKNEKIVQAFVDASIEGWRDYIWNDPSAGNELIMNDNPEMTPELLAYAANEMRRNEMLGTYETVGQITLERWNVFHKEMSELGLFEETMNVSNALDLRFLHKVKQDSK